MDLTQHESGEAPVFLDTSGRRHRIVRAAGWALAAIVLAYLALLSISLTASPGFLPFSFGDVKILPDAAAPKIQSDRPTVRPATSAPPTNATSPAPGSSLIPSNSATRAGRTTSPGSRPTLTHGPQGNKPTAHPTSTHTPQGNKPTAHPTQTHTPNANKPTAHPTQTRASRGSS